MTEIFIDDKKLDLKEVSIEFKFTNPMFSEGGFKEGFSYNFAVPKTPWNLHVLGTKTINNCRIDIDGVNIEKGKLVKVDTDNTNVKVQFISYSMWLKQELKKVKLADLDLDVIDLGISALPPADKIDAWANHYTQVMDTEPSTEGKYKFPMIRTEGYNDYKFGDEEEEDSNIWWVFNNRIINITHAPGLLKNTNMSYSSGSPRMWANTIAPCPKIHYLLEKALQYFKINLTRNDLDAILEYRQLWCFNNYVLDKQEVVAGILYNTWADTIDLKNHVPEANAYQLFLLLNELFDGMFTFDGSRLVIRTSNSVLVQPPVNLNNYSVDSDTSSNSGKTVVFSYEESDKEKNRKQLLEYDTTSGTYAFFLSKTDRTYPEDAQTPESYQFSFIALWSGFGYIDGYCGNFGELDAKYNGFPFTPTAQGEYQAVNWSFEKVVSNEYPEEDNSIFSEFRVGFYRGKLTSKKDTGSGIVDVDHRFSYNYADIHFPYFPPKPFDLPAIGKTDLYISSPKNAIDAYKLKRLKAQAGIIEITKRYVLSVPLLAKLLQFTEPRHYIRKNELSFYGVVKDVKFTAVTKGLETVDVVFVIENPVDEVNRNLWWLEKATRAAGFDKTTPYSDGDFDPEDFDPLDFE
jgi:hypothetical protein